WKLLFFDVAPVHRVYAVSFDAAVLDVASTVSAACIVAAGICICCSRSVPADYVPAGLLTDIESADLIYRRDYCMQELRNYNYILELSHEDKNEIY
ncbi:hypothetical protein Tco_0056758, partial [Tanacetum coccineum]